MKPVRFIFLMAAAVAATLGILSFLEWRMMMPGTQALYAVLIGLAFFGLGILFWRVYQKREKQRQYVKVSKPVARAELVDPLTSREQEILQLLAEGLSNQELADQLFVSKNTIKTHLKSLYSKLQVERRTQAIARGRELGLLQT